MMRMMCQRYADCSDCPDIAEDAFCSGAAGDAGPCFGYMWGDVGWVLMKSSSHVIMWHTQGPPNVRRQVGGSGQLGHRMWGTPLGQHWHCHSSPVDHGDHGETILNLALPYYGYTWYNFILGTHVFSFIYLCKIVVSINTIS